MPKRARNAKLMLWGATYPWNSKLIHNSVGVVKAEAKRWADKYGGEVVCFGELPEHEKVKLIFTQPKNANA